MESIDMYIIYISHESSLGVCFSSEMKPRPRPDMFTLLSPRKKVKEASGIFVRCPRGGGSVTF